MHKRKVEQITRRKQRKKNIHVYKQTLTILTLANSVCYIEKQNSIKNSLQQEIACFVYLRCHAVSGPSIYRYTPETKDSVKRKVSIFYTFDRHIIIQFMTHKQIEYPFDVVDRWCWSFDKKKKLWKKEP